MKRATNTRKKNAQHFKDDTRNGVKQLIWPPAEISLVGGFLEY